MRSVTKLLEDGSGRRVNKPEFIHQLRVAIRRAEAAISAFETELRPRAVATARRRLRAVRKAAGAVRDCDVHETLLKGVEGLRAQAQRPVKRFLSARLERARRKAAEEVLGVATRKRIRRLRKAGRGLADVPRREDVQNLSPPTLLGAALRTFGRVAAETRAVSQKDLTSLENLHALRVSAKQVRYAVEIFRTCIPDSLCESTLTHLREFQALLGRVNDARQMSLWLADEAKYLNGAARPKSIPKGSTVEFIHEELRVIVSRLEAELAAAHHAALPQVETKLNAALGALEEWTYSTAMNKPDGEAQPADHRRTAGRRAEGAVERAHQERRQVAAQPA